MVENPPKDTPYVSPYLLVDDVDEQVDWVIDVLGFADQGRMKGPDGKTMHSAVRAGDGLVMMGSPGKTYQTPKQLGGTTSMIYVYVDDVDGALPARRTRARRSSRSSPTSSTATAPLAFATRRGISGGSPSMSQTSTRGT